MTDLPSILKLAQALPPIGKERLARIERLAPTMTEEQLARLYSFLETAARAYVQDANHVRDLYAEAKGVIHGARIQQVRENQQKEELRVHELENSEAEALLHSLNALSL